MKWKLPYYNRAKIRGIFLGVPIIRAIVFGGLYWGSYILGNYRIVVVPENMSIEGAQIANMFIKIHVSGKSATRILQVAALRVIHSS